MYNDGVITTEFTGYYDALADEYVYPTAHQNLVIAFSDWYLSADDGDFTTDGLTITSETGTTTDITIGNAPAKVLTATILNPNGLMDSLTWEDGDVCILVDTSTSAADTYNSWPCHLYRFSHHYGINSSGTAYYDSTSYAIGGSPKAVVVESDGKATYYTDNGVAYWNGSVFSVPASTDALTFMSSKYNALEEPLGIGRTSDGIPALFNNVTANVKTVQTIVPIGIFDFSNVDAYGVTFGVEAYDKMTLFDADATDWVANLDFTTPKTIGDLIDELMTEVGFTKTIKAGAVNTTVSWDRNPITNYASTYRQILKWLAEAIGCNARAHRVGQHITFYPFDATPVATITPDTIVSNTRTKNRYTVPQITRVICYNTAGAGYEDGVSGPPYYVIANPFIDPSDSLTPVTDLLGLLDGIPAYYPTSISVACYDPRIDCGDFVTVTAVDGTPYAVPIMHCTMKWNGMCKAVLTATGNQVREIPPAMTGNDLSSVANSNPSAVINRIEAIGITANKITVYDANHDILFDADTDLEKVNIAGFRADSNRFHGWEYSYLDDDPNKQFLQQTSLYKHGRIVTVDDGWMRWSSGPNMGLEEDVYRTAAVDTDHFDLYTRIDQSSSATGVVRATMTPWEISNYYGLGGADKQCKLSYGYLYLKDGNNSIVITANGPTPTSGYDQINNMASGTSYHTVTYFDLDPGTYLVQIHFAFANNTSGRRCGLLSYSQDSNSQIASMWRASAAPVNGENTFLNICGAVKVNATTTYYLNAMQNSGSGLNTFASYNYVRLA